VKRVVDSSCLPEFLLPVELEELPEEAWPGLSLMSLRGVLQKIEIAVIKYLLQSVNVALRTKVGAGPELKKKRMDPIRFRKTLKRHVKMRHNVTDEAQKLSTRYV
jgi:hypothetical protein